MAKSSCGIAPQHCRISAIFRVWRWLCRVADLFRGLQVDGDELTYASFAHGNAKKTVHFCHGQAVVRHYEKTGL